MRRAKLGELLGIAALMTGAPACSAGSEPADGLDARQEAWRAQEPERYVVQTCTLGIEPPGCIRAVVDGNGVTAAEERIFDPSAPSWEPIELVRRPLDDMFDRLREGVQEGCTVDELRYDDDFAYLESYALGCEGSLTEGRWVACFEPDAQELGACDEQP